MVSHIVEPAIQVPRDSMPPRPAPPSRSGNNAELREVPPTSTLIVNALRPDDVDPELLDEWWALYNDQIEPSNPFLSPPWVLHWYDTFVRPADRVILVAQRRVEDGDQRPSVVGIAPMHVHRPRLGPVRLARRLLPVGAGVGQTAYEIPGLLCAAGTAKQPVLRALARACRDLPVDWAELALTPEQGWFDQEWVASAEDTMTFAEYARPRACVVLPLEATWDATRAGLKRNVKESIRRSANRLKKDGRPWQVVRRGEDLDRSVVERFLLLHQARAELQRATLRHHPDAYRDDDNRRLVLDVLPELGRRGEASMFELYLDGAHVASQLALHSPGTSYVHSSGFREDTWSLGVVTHLQTELVRHAIERGDRVVNFSPGPNVSKTRWSEQLWTTSEFAFGAGPRSLAVRFGVFQALSAARTTLNAAARRRDQLASGSSN